MSMLRLVRACLLGTVLCVAVAPAGAHPPDLPVDTRDECVPEPPPTLDELGLSGLPDDGELLIGPGIVGSLDCVPESTPVVGEAISGVVAVLLDGMDSVRQEHARRMYRIAERCRRARDFEMAENCYQETLRLCPESAYARKAVQRIGELRTMRADGDAEAAEPPQEVPAKEQAPQGNYEMRLVAPACSWLRCDVDGLARGQKMYRIAERCRRSGDFEMAVNCYQETMLLCPESEYARKAERHIRRLQAQAPIPMEDHGEEQEPKPDEEPGMTPAGCFSVPSEGPSALLHETDHARMAEAKVLYYVGERCRRGGDLEMAYRCYEEAHRACPQCRHGKKALLRMRRIDEDRQTNARAGEEQEIPSRETTDPFAGSAALSDRKVLENYFPPIDAQLIPALDRLVDEGSASTLRDLTLVEQQSGSPADAEEQEYPLTMCGGKAPDSVPFRLFVEAPVRDLVLHPEEGEEQDSVRTDSEDLSDWLRQAVRVMRGAGSLRIDAARLGQLMAQGEGAIRELGCSLVHECGRAYVVYPARSR
jgi:tetratricopeptide (TPR) repeat protein